MASLLHLVNLTKDELLALDPQHTLFLIPVSPIEDHGPHLPLGLDLYFSTHLCTLIAEDFSKLQPQFSVVLLPACPIALDSNTSQLNLTVRPHVLRDWLIDICLRLNQAAQFRYFACVSEHLGPKQLTAIEEAGTALYRKTASRWYLRTFQKNHSPAILISASSCLVPSSTVFHSPFVSAPHEHAGKLDTSRALNACPEHVKPIYKNLPELELVSGFFERIYRSKSRAIKGYWGAPALADAEIGKASFQQQSSHISTLIHTLIEKRLHPRVSFKTWYSLFPPNWSFFKAWLLFALLFSLLCGWVLLSLNAVLHEQ